MDLAVKLTAINFGFLYANMAGRHPTLFKGTGNNESLFHSCLWPVKEEWLHESLFVKRVMHKEMS